MDPSQPNELLPFLCRVVQAGAPFECHRAELVAGGTFRFHLTLAHGQRAEVDFCVAGAKPGGLGLGDGCVLSRDEACQRAVAQVHARLRALLAQKKLPLCELRNKEAEVLVFDARFFERLCPDLLRPGVTRVEELVCRVCSHVARAHLRVEFSCDGDGQEIVDLLVRHSTSAGVQIVLAGRQSPVRSYIEHIVRTNVAPGARLDTPEPPVPEQDQNRSPGRYGDKGNPCLHDETNRTGLLMSAVFQCGGDIVPVFACDRECVGLAAYLAGPFETSNLLQWHPCNKKSITRKIRFTDTQGLDAILTGSEEEVERLIRQGLEGRPDLLVAHNTCPAKVIGDEIFRVVDRLGDDAPVVAMDVSLADREDNYNSLWRQLLARFADGEPPQADAPRVNLIGHVDPRGRAICELRELLARQHGVDVPVALLPTFDIAELPRFGQAQLNAILPAELILEAFLWAQPLCRAPLVHVPAPYGFAGTRAWIKAITSALGLSEQPLERDEAKERRWTQLRSAAGEHGLGLVLTDDHFGSKSPEYRGPLPWLSLFAELGFRLTVFRLPSGNPTLDDHRRAIEEERLREALSTCEHVVEDLSSRELGEALRGAEIDLIYTEVWRDQRAAQAGKVPISFLDFEMGFDGALRSMERLLGYCRAPFFRRYGAFSEAGS